MQSESLFLDELERLDAGFRVNLHEVEPVAQIANADVVEMTGDGLDQLTVNVHDFGMLNFFFGADAQQGGGGVRVEADVAAVVLLDTGRRKLSEDKIVNVVSAWGVGHCRAGEKVEQSELTDAAITRIGIGERPRFDALTVEEDG